MRPVTIEGLLKENAALQDELENLRDERDALAAKLLLVKSILQDKENLGRVYSALAVIEGQE